MLANTILFSKFSSLARASSVALDVQESPSSLPQLIGTASDKLNWLQCGRTCCPLMIVFTLLPGKLHCMYMYTMQMGHFRLLHSSFDDFNNDSHVCSECMECHGAEGGHI